MKEIELKLLTAADVSEVVALDCLCLGGLWQPEAYLREIDSDKSTLFALHLSESKTIKRQIIGIGCLWSIVDEAHITLLAIHPDYRRQGLGQLLLFELLEDAIARKLERATLEVSVNNIGAQKLYQKFGFQTAGTRKGYYQKTGEDALILWRKGINRPEFALNLVKWQKKAGDRLEQNSYRFG